MSDVADLQNKWAKYRDARTHLLCGINIRQSLRDPMSEFAEVLVVRLVDGELAPNRVQKDWDVACSLGHVQVKYLSNPSSGSWGNWHTIEPNEGMDWYALVIYLDLSPVAVYMFPRGDLTEICGALGKRHGDQATTLQFTKTNHRDISADPAKFEALGMRVFLL